MQTHNPLSLMRALIILSVLLVTGLTAGQAPAPNGQSCTVKGTVTLAATGTPLHNASVLLSPLGRMVSTDAAGEFTITNLAPGAYTLMAHMHALTDERQAVTLAAGATVTVQFALKVSPLRESITVTATGTETPVADAFQTVTSLDAYQLAAKSSSTSLGDLLDNEAGIAKRSFGPGTTRPVVRGFDGDRVLILQDGARTGTLSSQSGDHGEPVDSANIERVEIVRGPATLLYGSNAIGGVVNVLTDHHIINQHPHEGLHLTLNGVGGTSNSQGGGSGSFEYGKKDWMLYGSGGGMRTSDYNTPLGKVLNSATEMTNYKLGAGHYGEKFSFNTNVQNFQTTYGIPAASKDDELPILNMRRNSARLNGAVKQLGSFAEQFQFDLSYSDYNHKELVEGVIGTEFFNKQFTYNGVVNQKKFKRLTGSFGFWGLHRDYKTVGAEALAPPVKQNAAAVYGLEELTWNRIRLQFGGRLERNAYDPTGLTSRAFTGVSASAGVFIPTWTSGTLVVNYMHAYRAPGLEELYNIGPHPGNLAFEIGDPNLIREKSDGVEVSVRHQGRRVKAETNLFAYQMHDFVYFNPTGEVMEGLPVYQYKQADSRFLGGEARAQFKLAGPLWLNAGFDLVDARLTSGPLYFVPRIPPARGRLGFDFLWKGLNIRPEVIVANQQWKVAPNETRTPGYAVFHVNASYTVTSQHIMQTFTANTFNLGDRLYRNHLSFIKDFAPEIGRGVRFGYTFQWF